MDMVTAVGSMNRIRATANISQRHVRAITVVQGKREKDPVVIVIAGFDGQQGLA